MISILGIQRRIRTKLLECDSSTDSEYNPSSDDDDDEDEIEGSDSDESLEQRDEESNVKAKNSRKSINIKKSSEHNTRSAKYASKQDHFVLESDGYFAHQSTKKVNYVL